MKERLFGFDAREMWIPMDDMWDSERKLCFLAKPDVSHVLSTDTGVWSSIFDDFAWGVGGSEISIEGPGVPDNIVSSVYPLWLNLKELLDYICLKDTAIKKPCWVIAITHFAEEPLLDLRDSTAPDTISQDWEFLGFDVADGIHISGLSNCGYNETDRQTLEKKGWREHINQYHLIDNIETAYDFKLFSDNRVKEHAQFSVWGIYLIKKILAT